MNNEKQYRPVKTCYEHIGGKLGELMLHVFVEKKWIDKLNPADKNYFITAKGEAEFTKMGINLYDIKIEKL